MTATTADPAAGPRPTPRLRRPGGAGLGLGVGLATSYLSVVVLLPLAAIVARASGHGWGRFWSAVTTPEAAAALRLTLVLGLLVAAVNAVVGTLIAWVLVRDEFPGKRLISALIDLPFALPTIVAGLTLLALYGPRSPLHVDVSFTRVGITIALLFVTLPFVVRSVQPVLMALDPEVEEAAASLGARSSQIFRRIVLPSISPAKARGSRYSQAVSQQKRDAQEPVMRGHLGKVRFSTLKNPRKGVQLLDHRHKSLVFCGLWRGRRGSNPRPLP